MTNEARNNSDFIFPSPPQNCPADLAKPGSQYKLRAWLAMLGLILFGLIYLLLTAWFAWSAFFLLTKSESSDNTIFLIIQGVCSALIAIFFLKGLFFKKHSSGAKDYEITRAQEPRLFEFLDRLAAETKAPRPHKVFLSGGVNACVFYDLSILNFFFSGRKNLEIGLGLVNCLSLSEFKAVLAHEFGHFAQNSMAVGRWVYMAQQVATQLIFHRDWFDSLLSGISRFDLRVAWIGWLLRIVIWAMRSILDTLLSLVMLAHRALSREMEYQADLVAVTNTGSDPLVNALYRLAPADSAWDGTTSFVNSELKRGHKVEDLFSIQTRIIEHKRHILADEDYGVAPRMPAEGRESHRIFTPDLAQPPQMWSTHPANHLREENAKKTYIPSELDERSAWSVFENQMALCKAFTSHLLGELEQPLREKEQTLLSLDEDYQKHFLNPSFRGTYLGRSIVSTVRTAGELYETEACEREELYPEELTDILEKHRNLRKEEALLQALQNRNFEPVDGVIRFRGEVIKRGDLGEALTTVRVDLKASDTVLSQHDRKCRTYYRQLAQHFGQGWSPYLAGLLHLIHYADHSFRNLNDAYTLFQNTLAVVLADGNVSGAERKRLLADGNALYRVLQQIHQQADTVLLDKETASRMEKPTWKENFESFKLPMANDQNLGDWIDAASGWVGEMLDCLDDLREAALESLLSSEQLLDQATMTDNPIAAALAPPAVPQNYNVLLQGEERTLQTKLNFWDSFQTASGVGYALLRFAVAAVIVASAVALTVSRESLDSLGAVFGL